jgi:hypothetical protein
MTPKPRKKRKPLECWVILGVGNYPIDCFYTGLAAALINNTRYRDHGFRIAKFREVVKK